MRPKSDSIANTVSAIHPVLSGHPHPTAANPPAPPPKRLVSIPPHNNRSPSRMSPHHTRHISNDKPYVPHIHTHARHDAYTQTHTRVHTSLSETDQQTTLRKAGAHGKRSTTRTAPRLAPGAHVRSAHAPRLELRGRATRLSVSACAPRRSLVR